MPQVTLLAGDFEAGDPIPGGGAGLSVAGFRAMGIVGALVDGTTSALVEVGMSAGLAAWL